MSDCKHDDFDEYFGKCTECSASREQIIKEQFLSGLQDLYVKQLQSMGINTAVGYLDTPVHSEVLKTQDEFSSIVARWLAETYETVE